MAENISGSGRKGIAFSVCVRDTPSVQLVRVRAERDTRALIFLPLRRKARPSVRVLDGTKNSILRTTVQDPGMENRKLPWIRREELCALLKSTLRFSSRKKATWNVALLSVTSFYGREFTSKWSETFKEIGCCSLADIARGICTLFERELWRNVNAINIALYSINISFAFGISV